LATVCPPTLERDRRLCLVALVVYCAVLHKLRFLAIILDMQCRRHQLCAVTVGLQTTSRDFPVSSFIADLNYIDALLTDQSVGAK